MATTFDFTSWPPTLSESDIQRLSVYATSYALSHGLLYLPVAESQPIVPESAIHAPISLFPSPIPKSLFQQSQDIQKIYNVLYSRIASDHVFLDNVMGAEKGVGQVDDFVGQLWKGWQQLRNEGVAQPIQLGLFRSDYLLHGTPDGLGLKQVEFNTISSSFGPLSERAAAMHRHLCAQTGYFGHVNVEQLPPNETTSGLATGIANAHQIYNVPGAQVLFVVQPNERNVFDQRWLEYELLEKHGIRVVRQTFDDLAESAAVSDDSRRLVLSGSIEISVIYFRAGYTPNDFPTPKQYETRFLLEKSLAIKCPSIPLQLAGGKKVQQVLTNPGVLEHFLPEAGATELDALRASWVEMWGLDEDPNAERALEQHLGLVLKPQREGGGNNIYKAAIPGFLTSLPVEERQAWIAMELIKPPEHLGGYLIRAGKGTAVRKEVISELGIFGWSIFGHEDQRVDQDLAGWLVRTKGKDSDEGGVATGFSVLDSVLLVDG